ncbi:MAG: hypothetical protein HYZ42_18195, partial [Bacteroidetes bacterium]|nr:hypothetical protein [Bacteroidota bacterium]
IQKGIDYYDSSGKTIKLKPESAKEIRFKYGYQEIRMVSCVDNLKLTHLFSSNKKIFLRLQRDGKLRLYSFYYAAGSGGNIPGSYYMAEQNILQKQNEKLFRPRGLKYEKDLKRYLSDCPLVVTKIDDGIYKYDLLITIVMDYNRCRTK